MNQTVLTALLKLKTDYGDALNGAKQLQNVFSGLKLGDKLTKDLKGAFESVFSAADTLGKKLASAEKNGLANKGDITKLDNETKAFTNSLNKVLQLFQQIKQEDISQSIKFEDNNQFQDLNKQLEQCKKDLDNLSKSSGTEAISRLDKALSNISSKSKAGTGLQSIINDLKNGDIEQATEKFEELNNSISKTLKTATTNANKTLGTSFDTSYLVDAMTNASKYQEIINQASGIDKESSQWAEVSAKVADATAKLEVYNQLKDTSAGKTLTNYGNAQNTLGNQLINTDDISVTQQKIDELNSEIEKLKQELANVKSDKIKELAENTDKAKGAMEKNGKAVKDSAVSINQMNSEAEQLISRFTKFTTLSGIFTIITKSIRSAFNAVKELDAAMNSIAVVTDMTTGDLWNQIDAYTQMANQTGSTITGAYQVAQLYYQQGLSTAEVTTMATETLKLARIAGIDYAKATDYMTAAIKGFGLEYEQVTHIMDVYSNLAARTAADTEEISIAMSKVASIAHSTGMELETTAAFLTQIIATTREAPETAGTALKTVVARFAEVKKLVSEGENVGSDEEGQEIDVNKIETALKSAKVALRDTTGQMRDLDDVFIELASKWDSLDTMTQRFIATQAAGSRQQSRFLAMMNDYEGLMETLGYATDSAGASNKQFEKTMDSLESKLNGLKNAWTQFTTGITNSDFIKAVVDALTKLLNDVNKLTGSLGGTGAAISRLLIMFGGLRLAGGTLTTLANSVFQLNIQSKGLGQAFSSLVIPSLVKAIRLTKEFGSAEEAYKKIATAAKEAAEGVKEVEQASDASASGLTKAFLKIGSAWKAIPLEVKIVIGAIAVLATALTLLATADKRQAKALQEYRDSLKELGEESAKAKEKIKTLNDVIEEAYVEFDDAGNAIQGTKKSIDELVDGVNDLNQNVSLSEQEFEAYQGILQQLVDTGFADSIEEANKKLHGQADGISTAIGLLEQYRKELEATIKTNAAIARQNYRDDKKAQRGDEDARAELLKNTRIAKEGKTKAVTYDGHLVTTFDRNGQELIAANYETWGRTGKIGEQDIDEDTADQYLAKAAKIRAAIAELDEVIEDEKLAAQDAIDTSLSQIVSDIYSRNADYAWDLEKNGLDPQTIIENMMGSPEEWAEQGDRNEKSIHKALMGLSKILEDDSTLLDGVKGINKNKYNTYGEYAQAMQDELDKVWANSDVQSSFKNKQQYFQEAMGFQNADERKTAYLESDFGIQLKQAVKDAGQNITDEDIFSLVEGLNAKIVAALMANQIDLEKLFKFEGDDGTPDNIATAISDRLKSGNYNLTPITLNRDQQRVYDQFYEQHGKEQSTISGAGLDKGQELNKAYGTDNAVDTAIKELAQDYLVMSENIDAANKAMDDNQDILKTGTKGIQKYDQACADVADAINEAFDTKVNEDWVDANKEVIDSMDESEEGFENFIGALVESDGVQDYFEQIQKKGGDALKQVTLDAETAAETFRALGDSGVLDLEGEMGIDTTPFLQAITQAFMQGKISAEEFSRIMASLGYEADITYGDLDGEGGTRIPSKVVYKKINGGGTSGYGGGGGGGGGGGKSNDYKPKQDIFYDYIKAIEELEDNLDQLQRWQELYTDPSQVRENIEAQVKEYERLIAASTAYVTATERELARLQDTAAQKYSKYVKITEDGALQLTEDYYKLTGDVAEELDEWIDNYEDVLGKQRDLTEELEDYYKDLKDMFEDMRDQYIDLQDELVDIFKEADEKILEDTEKMYDTMEQQADDYLDAVKKNIDEERKAREKADSYEEISKKQKRLALLQRDTSGRYDTEIASLQEEIANSQQDMADQKIDDILQGLEDQMSDDEKRHKEILDKMQEQIDTNVETRVYIEQANAIIEQGTDAILAKLMSGEEYRQASDDMRQKLVDDWGVLIGDAQQYDQWKNQGIIDAITFINTTVADAMTNEIEAIQEIYNLFTGPSSYSGGGGEYYSSESLDSGISPQTNVGKAAATGIKSASKNIAKNLQTTGQVVNNALQQVAQNFADIGLGGGIFAKGGIVDYTGPAWVDGTKSAPEAFLNPNQTNLIGNLAAVLESMSRSGNSLPSIMGGGQSCVINIDIGNLGTDYDIDAAINKVKSEIVSSTQYRNVNIFTRQR